MRKENEEHCLMLRAIRLTVNLVACGRTPKLTATPPHAERWRGIGDGAGPDAFASLRVRVL